MQAPAQSDRSGDRPRGAQSAGQSDIILVGSSIRSAAQSAVRGGYRVIGIDLFGDADTRAVCDQFARLDDVGAVAKVWEQHPATPVIQVSGLSSVAARLSHLGATVDRLFPTLTQQSQLADVKLLEHFAKLSGFSYPETIDIRSGPLLENLRGRWLVKPNDGSGGIGIRWYEHSSNVNRQPSKDRAENKCLTPFVRSTRRAGFRQMGSDTFFPLIANHDEEQCKLQRWIGGRNFGATLLIRAHHTEFLGACRSIFHSFGRGLRRMPFVYSGSLGPVPCSPSIIDSLVRIGNEVHAVTGLEGLCNVDFIIDRVGEPWLLEINPRWSGSSELIERCYIQKGIVDGNWSLLRHAFASRVATLHQPLISQQADCEKFQHFKQVIFARHTMRFREHCLQPFLASGIEVVDLPNENSLIHPGDPICSVIISRRTHDLRIVRKVRRAIQGEGVV